MIRYAIQFAVVLLTFMLPMAGSQTPAAGSIEGIVVSTGTSTPVPRATVTLETIGGRDVAEATTAVDGHFEIPRVAPGEYQIFAVRDGFISGRRGAQFTVAAGRKTEVSLGIIPAGAISGRVLDWDGLPVVGIQVDAMTFTQDAMGRRVLSVSRSAETNDLGEYRIYWVQPGPYFVRADPGDYGTKARELRLLRAVQPSEQKTQQFISTYFPSAVDAAGARLLNFRAGEVMTGADIRLIDARKHRVSGVVSTAGNRTSTDVLLTPRNAASGITAYSTTADRTGSFGLDNVVPGSYFLTAHAKNKDGVETFGRIPIDVGIADIGNLSVALLPGYDLRIRLTIEGRLRRSDDPPLVVNLRPSIPSTPFPTVERNGNDEFTMHRVMLGDYSVGVLSLSNGLNSVDSPAGGGLFLKSAQYGGADVLTTGLHVEGPPSGILDIVMADGAGTLTGTVLDDQGKPASVVTVVLVPELRLRGRRDLYKTVTTDLAGNFEVSGIAPGQYKAFSWEAAKQGEWQYPDFMELYEDRGQPIRIDGSRRDPISVPLILSIN